MIQINRNQKIKLLILVVLLKGLITILKSMKQRVKFLILVIQQQTAVASVENKIPNISNLVKKKEHNAKVTEIENKLNNHNHDKCIDNSEFNKLAVDAFNARIAQD